MAKEVLYNGNVIKRHVTEYYVRDTWNKDTGTHQIVICESGREYVLFNDRTILETKYLGCWPNRYILCESKIKKRFK